MFVYLPIEVKSRDLYPRLLLAHELLKKNFRIIIGRKSEVELYSQYGPKGIYVTLQATKNYYSFYKKLKIQGHKIALLDEESLVTFSENIYLSTRAPKKVLLLSDIIFTWGEFQKKILFKKKLKIKKKTFAVGNPRFDLYQDKFFNFFRKKTKIKFKNIILINSSFPNANHFDESKNSINFRKSIGLINNSNDEKGFLYFKKYNQKKIEIYIELANFLAEKLNNFKVLYKSHPSESLDVYKKKLSSKVILLKDTDIVDCLVNSNFVIHDFCTTAFEALACKKFSISLKKNTNIRYLSNTPYIFSKNLKSKEAVLNFVKKNYQKQNVFTDKKIEKFVKNFFTKNCSRKIAERLFNLKIKKYKKFHISIKNYLIMKFYEFKLRVFKNKYLEKKNMSILESEIKIFYNYIKLKKFKSSKIISNLFYLSK